eukprot:Rmarinus@m.27576
MGDGIVEAGPRHSSCTLCSTIIASSDVEAHIAGKKHRKALEMNRFLKRIGAKLASLGGGVLSIKKDRVYCSVCNTFIPGNSEANVREHLSGLKHKEHKVLSRVQRKKSTLNPPSPPQQQKQAVVDLTDSGTAASDAILPYSMRPSRTMEVGSPASASSSERSAPHLPPDAARTKANTKLSGEPEEMNFIPLEAPSEPCVNADSEEDDFNSLPPWCTHDGYQRNLNSTISLHHEILDFYTFVQPTTEEKVLRTAAVGRVKMVITEVFPGAESHVFGSFACDLYLPSSDIDMCVMLPGMTPDEPVPLGKDGPLEKLARALKNKNMTSRLQVIDRAKVPIVKFVEKASGVAFDICFNLMNGVENVKFVSELAGSFVSLRPLLLVVKYFLHQRDLNETYTGGIGSYALLLILCHHLQMYRTNFGNSYHLNLGEMLINFFELYGRRFNYVLTGISLLDGGSYFPKIQRGWLYPDRPYALCIEDPQNSANEMGANSFGILRIRRAFEHALRVLSTWRPRVEYGPTMLSSIIHVTKSLRERLVVIDSRNRRSFDLMGMEEQRRRSERRVKECESSERRKITRSEGARDCGGKLDGQEFQAENRNPRGCSDEFDGPNVGEGRNGNMEDDGHSRTTAEAALPSLKELSSLKSKDGLQASGTTGRIESAQADPCTPDGRDPFVPTPAAEDPLTQAAEEAEALRGDDERDEPQQPTPRRKRKRSISSEENADFIPISDPEDQEPGSPESKKKKRRKSKRKEKRRHHTAVGRLKNRSL